MIFNRHNLIRIAGVISCCLAFGALAIVNTGRAAQGQGEVDLPLVKEGKPVASIVIGEEASRSAQLAAAELQYHIEKITGARLPVVSDEEAVKDTRILSATVAVPPGDVRVVKLAIQK